MYILKAEFEVLDYAEWKKAFDSDPAGRQKSGVLQYHLMRPVDDSKYVVIDFEFETREKAEAFVSALRNVWESVGEKVMRNPVARIMESVDLKRY